jgi:hypothetical protein
MACSPAQVYLRFGRMYCPHLQSKAGLSNAAPAGVMAPEIYFPGALIYSAGFNVNQNLKKKNISK